MTKKYTENAQRSIITALNIKCCDNNTLRVSYVSYSNTLVMCHDVIIIIIIFQTRGL